MNAPRTASAPRLRLGTCLLLAFGYLARAVLAQWVPLAFFRLALPVLVSLSAIRFGAKVLQAAFPAAGMAQEQIAVLRGEGVIA